MASVGETDMSGLQGKRILIVEDEREIGELLAIHLGDLGAEVVHELDGEAGRARIGEGDWDLALLDIQLPGVSGLALCRELRQVSPLTPVILLTARDSELDRVIGLDQGADDYITKPFSVLELISRVKALFRRIEILAARVSAPASTVRVGDLEIDVDSREVALCGRPVDLTGTEFDLLLHFARHPNRVYRRSELLDAVWGYGHAGYEHTVNSHINRLRGKIECESEQPRYIQTVWGVGYKMVPPPP